VKRRSGREKNRQGQDREQSQRTAGRARGRGGGGRARARPPPPAPDRGEAGVPCRWRACAMAAVSSRWLMVGDGVGTHLPGWLHTRMWAVAWGGARRCCRCRRRRCRRRRCRRRHLRHPSPHPLRPWRHLRLQHSGHRSGGVRLCVDELSVAGWPGMGLPLSGVHALHTCSLNSPCRVVGPPHGRSPTWRQRCMLRRPARRVACGVVERCACMRGVLQTNMPPHLTPAASRGAQGPLLRFSAHVCGACVASMSGFRGNTGSI